MNKQRKVVITITYNEMGIIIDTKAEELGSSAQPERKTGKWIKASESRGTCLYKCSECGNLYLCKHSFCPNCGADMRGDKDER